MMGNFGACWAFTRLEEGGYIADPTDPGCWTGGACGRGTLNGTAYGISAAAYPMLDIKTLTEADAATIMQKDYWDTVSGNALVVGLDLAVWDFAVNGGPGTSVMALQGLLRVTQDGIVGPQTLAAIASHQLPWLINTLTLSHQAIYRKDPLFQIFGSSWMARSGRCNTAALAMARAAA